MRPDAPPGVTCAAKPTTVSGGRCENKQTENGPGASFGLANGAYNEANLDPRRECPRGLYVDAKVVIGSSLLVGITAGAVWPGPT